MSPYVGALWTPGYWVEDDNRYAWHGGYWGNTIGFYGGVNYGYGYSGRGYQGGYWRDRSFRYNRAANNIGQTRVVNTYNVVVTQNTSINHVSYNGGAGGIRMRPTSLEQALAGKTHTGPTTLQLQHEQSARVNPLQRVAQNHGTPAIPATPKAIPLHNQTPALLTTNRVSPTMTRNSANEVNSVRSRSQEFTLHQPLDTGSAQLGDTHQRSSANEPKNVVALHSQNPASIPSNPNNSRNPANGLEPTRSPPQIIVLHQPVAPRVAAPPPIPQRSPRQEEPRQNAAPERTSVPERERPQSMPRQQPVERQAVHVPTPQETPHPERPNEKEKQDR